MSVNPGLFGTEFVQKSLFTDPVVSNVNLNDETNGLPPKPSISNESIEFVLTRYSFLSFIIRFNSGKVTKNQVRTCWIDHCKIKFQTKIQIFNCRLLTL